jgi:hypothetical protein
MGGHAELFCRPFRPERLPMRTFLGHRLKYIGRCQHAGCDG